MTKCVDESLSANAVNLIVDEGPLRLLSASDNNWEVDNSSCSRLRSLISFLRSSLSSTSSLAHCATADQVHATRSFSLRRQNFLQVMTAWFAAIFRMSFSVGVGKPS